MITVNKIDIQELSQSDRILLAEQRWDSITDDQDTIEVTDSQMKILKQRLEAYNAPPNEGTSWEQVKKEMQ